MQILNPSKGTLYLVCLVRTVRPTSSPILNLRTLTPSWDPSEFHAKPAMASGNKKNQTKGSHSRQQNHSFGVSPTSSFLAHSQCRITQRKRSYSEAHLQISSLHPVCWEGDGSQASVTEATHPPRPTTMDKTVPPPQTPVRGTIRFMPTAHQLSGLGACPSIFLCALPSALALGRSC